MQFSTEKNLGCQNLVFGDFHWWIAERKQKSSDMTLMLILVIGCVLEHKKTNKNGHVNKGAIEKKILFYMEAFQMCK